MASPGLDVRNLNRDRVRLRGSVDVAAVLPRDRDRVARRRAVREHDGAVAFRKLVRHHGLPDEQVVRGHLIRRAIHAAAAHGVAAVVGRGAAVAGGTEPIHANPVGHVGRKIHGVRAVQRRAAGAEPLAVFRFVGTKVFQQAAKVFGESGAPLKVLVVPSLPHTAEEREKSIALLRAKGVDAVIPFRTMLADLVTRTESNRNYQKSDLLQTIRILKNYDFLKEPQMELFKSKRRRR